MNALALLLLWKLFEGPKRTLRNDQDPLTTIEFLRGNGIKMTAPASTQEPFEGTMFSNGADGIRAHLVKWDSRDPTSWAYGILNRSNPPVIVSRGTGPQTARLVQDLTGRRAK